LRIDASVFYIKWRKIQRNVYLTGCGESFIANLGAASSRSFDLTLNAEITSRLQLTVALGYTDVKLDDTSGGPGTAAVLLGAKGDKIGGPPFTAAVSGQYELPILRDEKAYILSGTARDGVRDRSKPHNRWRIRGLILSRFPPRLSSAGRPHH
jgi:hypothetical protein